MARTKNLKLLSLFLSLSFLAVGFNKALPAEVVDSCQYTSDIFLRQADSLLKLGNENEALILYLKALDLSESYSSLQLPTFKKVGEVYLKKREYRKAIGFFGKYEWMATQQLISDRGYMPDDGVEWWGSDDEINTLEKELIKFDKYLSKLEEKHLNEKNSDLEGVANYLIATNVTRTYASNFRRWSDSLKATYRATGSIDQLKVEKLMCGWRPDSCKIYEIKYLKPNRSRVFVKEFAERGNQAPSCIKLGSMVIYNFIKENDDWKFNGFDYEQLLK